MENPSESVECFYSSDDDVAWGPVTPREIRRYLAQEKNVNPKQYRRQTIAILPAGTKKQPETTNMETPINSTLSSNMEYYTANESVDSGSFHSRNLKVHQHIDQNKSTVSGSSESEQENNSLNNLQDSNGDEIISISSDEDEGLGTFHIKNEQVSKNSSSSFVDLSNPISTEDQEVLNISSEDEGFEIRETTSKSQDNLPDEECNNRKDIPLVIVTSFKETEANYSKDSLSLEDENIHSHNQENFSQFPVLEKSPNNSLGISDDFPSTVSSEEHKVACSDGYSSNIQSESLNSSNISSNNIGYSPSSSPCNGGMSLDDTLEFMDNVLNGDLEDYVDETPENNRNYPEKNRSNSSNDYSDETGSKIPIPASYRSNSLNSSSSRENNFKIPQKPLRKVIKSPFVKKSAPGERNLTPVKINSPDQFKNIISPVRMYIKNSSLPVLKQTCKPSTPSSRRALEVNTPEKIVRQREHKNLVESFPEIIYKPSKQVENFGNRIIVLPENINRLIKERVVIKHEIRRQINLDESELCTSEKLCGGDLSCIINDVKNVSIHTQKNGFNV
ncbi:hypothetical protein HHI36_022033 [Cryptolaemus montrouzieri]|uniref:Uncharacterized protein n=1 Tax=Cryptolaemus montrouzieri TaxID=559131 RepID=A0ABD2MYJ1_9CUCU